ncbi:MAG: M20 family metallopeptidase [Clostridium sp.]
MIENKGKKKIVEMVEKNKEELINMAKLIWENPEEAYTEKYASALQKDYLRNCGFRIKAVDTLDTAFIAEFGEGYPIIGVLGEYDALPGLSQKISAHKEYIIEEGLGHGCGHNLLGTAGVGAVIALKNIMKEEGLKGTIRYYGCPAEEGGAGKVAMGRVGCFKDLDTAFSWHPFDINTPLRSGTLANFSVRFRFRGVSSHAAQAPHNGKSALDGVELMNVGSNYLREHLVDSIRIHYIITNGGDRPNIVPDFAQVWYYVRGRRAEDVKDAFQKVINVAKGAAMMTGTHVEYKILSAIYDYFPNQILTDLIANNLSLVGAPEHTEEDERFAKELAKTFTGEERLSVSRCFSEDDKIINQYIHDDVTDFIEGKHHCLSCSTDVGDVSHMIPTAQLSGGAWPIGTAAHTWQSCAASGTNLGFSAMIMAAKVIACSVYDVFKDNTLVKKAQEEFKEEMGSFKYIPLMDTVENENNNEI